jgi:hypothetical protein
MMAILAPRLFAAKFGIDLNDEKIRQRFIQRLVERLL